MFSKYKSSVILLSLCLSGAFLVGADTKPTTDEAIAAVYNKPQACKQLELRMIQTLQDNSSRQQKERACRILRVIGTKDAIPALAALLPDKNLSHMARYALEPMPYPQAGKALREALAKTTGQAKAGIINSLGIRRDAKAAALLVPLLKDKDKLVAATAAWALGRTATPATAETLIQFYQHSTAELHQAAVEACLNAAEVLGRQVHRSEALRIYQILFRAKEPEYVRMAAFDGLVKVQPEKAVARILEAMDSNDPAIQKLAIAQVANVGGRESTQRFAARLNDLPATAQVYLITALVRRADPAALPVIAAAARQNPSIRVRTAALKALGDLGQADSVKILIHAIDDERSPEEVQTALAGLRRISGEGIDAAIINGIKQSKPSSQAALIEVLRDRHAGGAVAELILLAGSRQEQVRKAAFKALAELAGPGEFSKLIQFLVEMQDEQVRRDAERAAALVARKFPNQVECVNEITKALQTTRQTAAKSSLLRVLQGIGNKSALDVVTSYVDNEQSQIRDTAIRALADWPGARALKPLMKIIQNTDNETHRVVALRGSVRLLEKSQYPDRRKLALFQKLLQNVRRPGEKKLVIAGIAKLAEPRALKVLEPLLQQNEIKDEAETALVHVAGNILGVAPEASKATAEKLLQESKLQPVRQQAAAILAELDKIGDYIIAWQVAGPYTKAGANWDALIDVVFAPELNGKQVSWRVLPVNPQSSRIWMLDLLKTIGGEKRVAYVRTWIYSDKAQAARLEFGSDDGNKVWLNGQVVFKNGAGGGAIPGEHKVPVKLHQGWNSLMLKISQDTGPWEFCLRIRKPDGSKLTGLIVQANPPS